MDKLKDPVWRIITVESEPYVHALNSIHSSVGVSIKDWAIRSVKAPVSNIVEASIIVLVVNSVYESLCNKKENE